MLTTRQMLYFEALADTGHFGRAAGRAHVSQPALSAQIAEMERDLGFSVVERRPSGAVLTPRGTEALNMVRTILAGLRELERLSGESGLFNGVLRLGIIPTVAPYLLPLLVPALRKSHPALRLEVREATTAQLTAALSANEMDCFIAALPIDEPGLASLPLFNDRFFVASASNDRDVLSSPDHGGIPVERLLLLEEGHCLRDQALDVCGLKPGRRILNYGATSLTTLLQMVEHGMGLTLVPEIALNAECRNRSLTITPFGDPVPKRSLALFHSSRAANRAEFEALTRLAAEAARPLLRDRSQKNRQPAPPA